MEEVPPPCLSGSGPILITEAGCFPANAFERIRHNDGRDTAGTSI